jgi:hypothetical protein
MATPPTSASLAAPSAAGATSSTTAGTGPGKLYVFFHGLIPLIQRPSDILALVVDMGDDHSYRAGDWLREVPLSRGFMGTLNNVTPGPGTLDPTKISILQHQQIFPSPHVYATLTFPRPKAIHSLRRTQFPATAGVFKGAGAGQVSRLPNGSYAVASLEILEYDFTDAASVELTGLAWTPTLFKKSDSSTPCATLHFFAEPECTPSESHSVSEFALSFTLFNALDLSVTGQLTRVPLEVDEYPVENLPISEALGLRERLPLLDGVAAYYKSGESGPLPGEATSGPGTELCAPLPGSTS